jgi:hypothetical protein
LPASLASASTRLSTSAGKSAPQRHLATARGTRRRHFGQRRPTTVGAGSGIVDNSYFGRDPAPH